jgi:hypothetical protein
MAHYAKIESGLVTKVLVAEQDFIDTLTDSTDWIQTSYNTSGGVHSDGGTPLRKNFAGIGFTYDSVRDAFISPQPYTSWILDEDTCRWEAPIPYPIVSEGGTEQYKWDEENIQWVLLDEPK